MTTVALPYGRRELAVRLPEDSRVTLIEKPPMPWMPDPGGSVEAALDAPVGSDRLEALARGCRTACIVVCDITRPVPNRVFLPALLDRLAAGGIPTSRTTVLIATGLHRPNDESEQAELLGDDPRVRAVSVVNHRARADHEHVHVGDTPAGTTVRLDRRFVESDLRIVTGLVEPHFMAGYSGGRKVIAPGLAHAETIGTLHGHRFMAHPATANCVMEGNPLHEELLAIARLVGDVFAFNTVIDEQRRLSFANFGEVAASHEDAVSFARRYSEVPVERRFKTVVTSAGGHPLDATYYQTVKGMVGPLGILDQHGDLIIASACSEGIGSTDFATAQTRLIERGIDGFLAGIATKDRADVDEWQSQMQTRAQSRARVQLFTDGLDARGRAMTGVETVDSVERAVADSLDRHDDEHVAVIPSGPYVVPVFAPA